MDAPLDIKADEMGALAPNANIIKSNARSVIDMIRSNIIMAAKEGNSSIVVDVPINFPCGAENNRNVQTMVYFAVIQSLENNGFGVEIDLGEKRCNFHVSWARANNTKTLKHMNGVLQSHFRRPPVAEAPRKKPVRRPAHDDSEPI